MAQLVQIPAALPRDAKAMRKLFDIGHMLRPRAIFGWIYTITGSFFVLVLLIALARTSDVSRVFDPPGIPIGFLASFLLGLLLVRSVRKIKRRRLRALTHGALMEARVVGHSMGISLAIVIKRLDTVIKLELVDPKGRKVRGDFRSPVPGLRARFPVGHRVQALFDKRSKALFFPIELGKEIELSTDGSA